MKQRSAACPACGGPVLFSPGAVVTVCDYCQSAVGRKDKKIEDYGKVSDLVQTSSRIRRGMTGKFRSKRFSIVGHVQYQHPAGGVWDEWYLAFPGGKWGWLAESQGKTHLMFERRLRRDYKLPAFESLDAGQTVRVVDVEFQVAEKGVALAGAAEGEIPWPFFPGPNTDSRIYKIPQGHSQRSSMASHHPYTSAKRLISTRLTCKDMVGIPAKRSSRFRQRNSIAPSVVARLHCERLTSRCE
jgi:hypothetical protein